MAANIFMREARDIVEYLKRYGYDAKIDEAKSVIVVQDPVWASGYGPNAGKLVPAPPKEVRFNGWGKAVKFVEERL
jgi:hypothetical protein